MNRMLILALVVLITGAPITAQKISLKGLKKKVEQKVRIKKSQKEDQAIDKGLEKIEESIEGSDQADEETSSHQDRMPSAEDPQEIDPQRTDPQVWSRYNFVPGDKIIFADDQMGEENGEFPSRWDLLEGNAENASMDGVNIINLKNNTVIMPLVDSANYLPEVFTIEFDAYFDNKVNPQYHRYLIRLWPGTGSWFSFGKNGKDYYYSINLYQYGAHLNGSINGQKKGFKSYLGELKSNDPGWRHIAIAFNQRSLKMFVDQYRVFNIPNLGFKPEMFSLGVLTQADGDNKQIKAIKNIRIAEGGKKLYDRVMTEGKFVTRGILFDVNKATLKPESMGVINQVVKLMQDHQDLSFSIEGHTDSDGDEAYNLKLSGQRAQAVKQALIAQGITADRLKTAGKGETVPLDTNTTPEGKANNRRVEFVKL